MKYSLLLLLVVILLPVTMFAQVSISPIIGLNNTRYKYYVNNKYINPDRNDLVLDYRIGAIADICLDNNNLYLQPGLVFTRNSQKTVDPWSKDRRLLFNINTIEIPLSIVVRSKKNSKSRWFLSPGFLFGVNVKATQAVSYYDNKGNYIGNGKLPIKIDKDTINSINPAFFGLRGDVGYQFDGGYSLRFFFQNAFTSLVKNPNPPDYRITRINYGLVFAYQFPLKNRRKEAELKRRK